MNELCDLSGERSCGTLSVLPSTSRRRGKSDAWYSTKLKWAAACLLLCLPALGSFGGAASAADSDLEYTSVSLSFYETSKLTEIDGLSMLDRYGKGYSFYGEAGYQLVITLVSNDSQAAQDDFHVSSDALPDSVPLVTRDADRITGNAAADPTEVLPSVSMEAPEKMAPPRNMIRLGLCLVLVPTAALYIRSSILRKKRG